MMRLTILALLVPLVLAACQKPEPRSSEAKPYEAQRIRTLTHDEDLQNRREPNSADLSAIGEALKKEAPANP